MKPLIVLAAVLGTLTTIAPARANEDYCPEMYSDQPRELARCEKHRLAAEETDRNTGNPYAGVDSAPDYAARAAALAPLLRQLQPAAPYVLPTPQSPHTQAPLNCTTMYNGNSASTSCY